MRPAAMLLLLLLPSIVAAETVENEDADQPQNSAIVRTFTINDRSELACAEVAPHRKGGTVTHEIIMSPKRIERCLLLKVGTRLHECLDLKIRKATVDEHNVVTIATSEGDVKFWIDEEASLSSADGTQIAASGDSKGTLTFTWPDNDRKYLCGTFK